MMNRRLALWGALASLLLSQFGCSGATAPTNSNPSTHTNKQSVYGLVTDAETGATLPGASVTLSEPDSSLVAADLTGKYRIDSIPPGHYTMYARMVGYQPGEESVQVDSGANTVLNFQLHQLSASGATLTVQVFDVASSEQLNGALVYVGNETQGIVDSGYTDSQGSITFTLPIANWIYAEAMRAGYYSNFDSVFVPPGSQGTMRLYLRHTPGPINLNDSLIACYRFSNNFVDSSGHGHLGARHGGTFVADRFGNASSALQLNGTSDYVSVPDSPELNFGKDQDFTVTMWVSDGGQPNRTSYLYHKGVQSGNVFTGYYNAISDSWWHPGFGTTYGEAYTDELNLQEDNRWHLVAISYSRFYGYMGLSIDGSEPKLISRSNLDGNINTTAPLLFGWGGTPGTYFKGKIDDVRIYHGALSGAFLNQLYHEYGW